MSAITQTRLQRWKQKNSYESVCRRTGGDEDGVNTGDNARGDNRSSADDRHDSIHGGSEQEPGVGGEPLSSSTALSHPSSRMTLQPAAISPSRPSLPKPTIHNSSSSVARSTPTSGAVQLPLRPSPPVQVAHPSDLVMQSLAMAASVNSDPRLRKEEVLQLGPGHHKRILGRGGNRHRQIQREAECFIHLIRDSTDPEAARSCQIQGTSSQIAKAKAIIKRLLDSNTVRAEEQRLDLAADAYTRAAHVTNAGQPRHATSNVAKPRESKSAAIKLSKSAGSDLPRSRSNPQSIPSGHQHASNGSDNGPTQAQASHTPQKSPADELEDMLGPESSDSSSEEDTSDDEQPVNAERSPAAHAISRESSSASEDSDSSEEESEDESEDSDVPQPRAAPGASASRPPQTSSAHVKSRSGTATSKPSTKRAPVPQVPTSQQSAPSGAPEGTDYIKIEDNSDDELPARPRTPDAVRRARALGVVPVNGMVTLEEFDARLAQAAEEKGKLEYKIKVMRYILHYEGVMGAKIERMLYHAGTAGEWDPKFENVLGHARKGDKKSGRPLNPQT